MTYRSSKTFGNERGLSCAFRQWKADSHCQYLHGYSIGVTIMFEARELDHRHWVYDFGGTKWIKNYLDEMFDHTTLVAKDDPAKPYLQQLDNLGVCQVRIVDRTGCEGFAEMIYLKIKDRVREETDGRVSVSQVTVFEHAANSAEVHA